MHCARCARPVAPGDGRAFIAADELDRAQAARAALRVDADSALFVATDTQPAPARWRVAHWACAPESLDFFWLPLSAVDTSRALAETGEWLSGRAWLGDTDWPRFADRLQEQAQVGTHDNG